MRILHISDTQWADGSEEKAIVAFTQREKTDYLIHTGDLVDRKRKFTPPQVREIIEAKLRILVNEGKLPLIIIPGNHDPYYFHRDDPQAKWHSYTEIMKIFRASGAIVPDGKALSLTEGIALSYLNRYNENDYFYGTAVNKPLAKPMAGQLNLAIAHGVGFVPYRKVFRSQIGWPQAIAIERKNTIKRLKEIIERGYDIILCGHHRHSNVPNGLFHYQGKLISLRGQHRTADRDVDQIAGFGSLIEIAAGKITANTVDFVQGKIVLDAKIKELPYEE